jgi:hypothetical protein
VPRNASILRWALPPGVSIAVHTSLIALLVIVGSRAASLAQPTEKKTKLPLAELEFSAPKTNSIPQDQTTSDTTPSETSEIEQQISQTAPSVLDRSAKALSEPTPVTSQAMSAATLDQLSKQSSELSAEPSSAPSAISFAGVSTGAARSIVYVIDTSGATLTSLSYIRERLLQSIDRLSPTQRFQVIAFRKLDDSTFATPQLKTTRNKLPRATRENKQAVAEWLSTMPARGQSNPVDGLAAAIELNPDMILLISRGIQRTELPWAGGLKHVRQRLDELNPLDPVSGTRPVVIKTIQLLDEDPTGIMRTIGVFHGDGHNDHQVITYNQLANPDPEPLPPPPTNADARLSAVEDQIVSLKASGVYYRTIYAFPIDDDQSKANEALRRINQLLDNADSEDPRAALLIAEASLLGSTQYHDPSLIQSIVDTLTESVFVSPELDARRRILLALLANDPSHAQSIQSLRSLLSERVQLNISDLTAASAVLAIAMHQEPDSQLLDAPPFTTDPAWTLLAAQTRSWSLLQPDTLNAFDPLLDLRILLPHLEPLIDRSIAALVDELRNEPITNNKINLLPQLVRFIDARTRLTHSDQDSRQEAITTLLTISRSEDQDLAEDSLWLACLGARALNTRDAGKILIEAASKLADQFPSHPGAADALAGAIDTASASNSPLITPLLRQAINTYPDRIEIDLWKLQLINLTTGQEQETLIRSLTPATRESDLGAQILHNNAMNERPYDLLQHAIETASILDALRSPLSTHWHRTAATLEIDKDPSSAMTRLARLVHNSVDASDPELELLYARSLIGANQPDTALQRLTQLATALNNNDSKDFWHAWTLIIETTIIHGNDSDKDNARAHLTRLKLMNPKLGPEPFRSRLIEAQNTLHSEP